MTSEYDKIIQIDGQAMTKKYIAGLDRSQREALIEPLFQYCRTVGYLYPDDLGQVDKEWKRLQDCEVNTDLDEVYNNSSVGTYVTKYFCRSFFQTTVINKKSMQETFEDDSMLKKLIANRLGLDWYSDDNSKQGNHETFNLSMKMIAFQGMRSMRLNGSGQISNFKPEIAKYIIKKFTQPGDTYYDYSCGFGARLLGAKCLDNIKYVGTDPLTVPELQKMVDYFGFKDIELIQSGSEDYRGIENSVDFSFSSPPYFNQEIYSSDSSQAYNHGTTKEEKSSYFYDVYWKKTLENVRFMLKPGKWFGLNVTNYPLMVEMAESVFQGKPDKIIKLKTVRSHLNKSGKNDAVKFEPAYFWLNNK